MSKKAILSCIFLLFVSVLCDAIGFDPAFGDGMVLQRGVKVSVSGKGVSGEKFTVFFAGQSRNGACGPDGRWKAEFDPMDASFEGRTMKLTGASGTVELRDVLVGDVWLCSGQSNMHWTLEKSLDGKDVAAASDFPMIRVLRAPYAVSELPKLDIAAKWFALTPENAGSVSAVAFFFGRELYLNRQVPIGLLCASYGGTMIEPWTPPGSWRNYPELEKGIVAQYSAKGNGKSPREWKENKPHVMYNACIHPMTPLNIRGVIWYQGCSNVWYDPAESYLEKLQALYEGLCKAFRHDNMPFYLVQLAPLRRGGKPGRNHVKISLAQQEFAARNDKVAIAIINDVGDLENIHPAYKEPVGVRLALLALRHSYGMDIKADSPVVTRGEREGAAVKLSFANVTEWHAVDSGEMRNFSLAGKDGRYYAAKAESLGANILVSSDKVPEPVSVRYLYSESREGNVVNEVGLPLGMFELKVEK